jgi:tetratricopeptide (TPR) repeat protein
MWLQRLTEGKGRQISLLLICATALAACGSTPKPQQAGGAAQTEIGPDGKPVALQDIPPQAQTMFEQAVAAMASGDAIDAELRFQEFLLQYPNYPGAYVNLAIIFSNRGDDSAAGGSITDALILNPHYAPALNQLGMLLRRQGSFPEAESAYMKAIDANPNYALAHYNLGVLNELYLQRLDIALQHFEHYQLLSGEDKQVTKWIADLKRRIDVSRRTASVTE